MHWTTLLAIALLVTACGRDPASSADTRPPADPGANFGLSQASAQPGDTRPFAPAKALPAGAVVLERARVDDPGLLTRGPALHGLIPAGWRTAGGVIAAQGSCSEPVLFDWRAISPDGQSTVALFPTEGWQWSNTQIQSQCRPGGAATVRDYLAERIAASYPGARILDYRERPDFAQGAREAAAISERNFNAAMGGMSQMRVTVEGGEALFAFTDNNGEKRGLMSAVAMFYISEAMNPLAGSPEFDPVLRGQPLRSVTGATLGTFAATAPAGALDFDLAEAVRRSFTPDPQWLRAYFDLKGKLGEIATQGVKERAAIIVAGGAAATRSNIAAFEAMTNASIANSNASIEAQRPGDGGVFPGDASGDRMQRETIEAIRGVETYRDPIDNANVQLDANYEHAWRVNGSNAYILTRDPNFNPGAYGVEATQMGVVK